jgi:hypothetical protein
MQTVKRFRKITVACLLALGILLTACSGNRSVRLVNNGRSAYVIAIADTVNPELKRAAVLLQQYLKKMGNAELPIEIGKARVPQRAVVIRLDPAVTHEDGFTLLTRGRQLIISGGAHKGCIYGVVDLLEKQWGCRMYAPGFESVPKLRQIVLPALDIRDQPVNEYRNVFSRFSENEDYRDWQRTDLIGDGFADGYYVHTMPTLVPPGTYFSSHPEYFALVDGKRIPEVACFSHPEVLQIAIRKLESDMALQPGNKVWSVSQNDYNAYCQCDACRKVIAEEDSPSGPVIRFVNKVAERFPDKTISTLAYQYSRHAPKLTKPAGNVQIMLCTIELNRSQPIAEDPRSASFVQDITDWGKIANHIYLWDYVVNFSHHVSPFPNLQVLQPNINFFVKNNVHSHFQQANGDVGHEFSELKTYLISRLLWNPEVKTDSIIKEFLDGYYGPAAPHIGAYLNDMQEQVTRSKEWLFIYDPPQTYENTFLSEESVARYNGWFDQALAAVKDQPEFLLHVRTCRLPLQYATMLIAGSHPEATRGWFVREGNTLKAREDMLAMLEDFHQTCMDAGVRTLHEIGPSPDQFYLSTLEFLKNYPATASRAK